ncbi:MAG: TolC family protein [Deltaproteobacteria bacterium]|nr:TolC family protein [Deltaproteobacteria bacterium]MBW2640155.1 TolC family protein [Deltaproteobacteria bacterium]MBW2681108.1 TolC family protein [Deltaproteobacteria bacterium]
MKQFLPKLIWLTSVAAVMVCIAPTGSSAGSSIWAPQPLSRLIEEGLANNQDIKSMESQVKGLMEEVSFSGSLNDPRIGIGLLNLPTDTFSFSQEPMTQKQLFIAQKIPWFGKLSLRSQQAAMKAIRQEAILKAKRLELARQVATAYYELGFVAGSQKINERLIGMLDQLIRVSETRYATGQGLQQDVLQAQVEMSKLLDEQITLGKKYRTLEDRINALLNRGNFIPVVPPENLPYPDFELEKKELQTRSLTMNPWLKVKQAEVDQANVEIELAQKDYWPDMDFTVAYGQREEDLNDRDLPDFFSASVVINIPLWQKTRQDKKLEATKLSHQAALQSYQNLANSLPHKIDALVSDIRNIRKNYKLITDALIVQAEQWARSSLNAYEVGKVEFSTMINAQIQLLRFELQSENYLFSLYKKRAELEEVLGEPVLSQNLGENGSHWQQENTS